MVTTLIIIFVIGYLCIATEHKIKIDKAATAIFMFGLMWAVYALTSGGPNVGSELLEHLGSTCETLIFLIGAMTIVDIIDTHGGFYIITKYIKTREKIKLLFLLAIITFFMSAVLDNMTTTIVMVMILRKIIPHQKDRWIFAGIIIIAANSGGAWSPIGDVTTIMLWMRENVTTVPLIAYLILPCLVSMFVPLLIVALRYKKSSGEALSSKQVEMQLPDGVGNKFSRAVFFLGVFGLLSVPVFKSVTGLPPYVGVMFVLGILWIFTEIIYYRKKNIDDSAKNRVSKVIRNIDMPTIIFFLGILMSVASLQTSGILGSVANFLDTNVHEVFTIASVVGVMSSVIDNVPLVAACMGMYPVMTPEMLQVCADPAYMQAFTQDGLFWLLLTYCAGVGGSILIIGSAAGVVAMGLEKINFGWYLKNIALVAFLGYVAGIVVLYLESLYLF